MDSRFFRKMTVAGAVALALLGSISCTYYGPPPHAPAHGYRWHVHDYYYYPGVQVYYHIYTGYYYYRSSGVWIRVRVLPRHIRIHRHDRVKIRIKDRRPYLHNEEHRHRYKPKKRLKTDRWHDREEREYLHKRHKDYDEHAEKYKRRMEHHEKRWKRHKERHEGKKGYNDNRKKHRRDDGWHTD